MQLSLQRMRASFSAYLGSEDRPDLYTIGIIVFAVGEMEK